MGHAIFTSLISRFILETETDADSPDNETTYGGTRTLLEGLILGLFWTGDEGYATTISGATLTDTNAAYNVDEHNYRTLLITSGAARGNFYTIDDTTATTLVCAGDNLETDGVLASDYYVVLYDMKVNSDGHDHDTVNSKGIVLGDDTVDSKHYIAGSIDEEHMSANSVNQNALKCSTTAYNQTSGGTTIHSTAGGSYTFAFRTYGTHSNNADGGVLFGEHDCDGTNWMPKSYTTSSTVACYVTTYNSNGTNLAMYSDVTYVTASGEIHWIFILKDKAGETIAIWSAPDHPMMGSPGIIQPFHAINGEPFDPAKYDIIVVNPSMDDVEKTITRMAPCEDGGWMTRAKSAQGLKQDYFKSPRSITDAFVETFEIQESQQQDWPDIPITVALPAVHNGKVVGDWRFMPQVDADGNSVIIEPVKIVIPKPDYITTLKYRERNDNIKR